ncbi:MAG: AMP-binding protein [Lautropia sp.]
MHMPPTRVADLRRRFAPAERTVPALLARQAAQHGARPLLVAHRAGSRDDDRDGDRGTSAIAVAAAAAATTATVATAAATTAPPSTATTLTFADAPTVAARAAGTLAAAGIGRGDRVAVFCGNRFEFVEIFLGCAWLGAVCVPVNTASKAPQLHYLLRDSGARLLVIEQPLLPVLELLPADALALEAIWVVGAGARDRTTDGAATAGATVAAETIAAATTAATTVAAPPALPRPQPMPPLAAPIAATPSGPGDDLAILYTSGTTGPSKGVRCLHAQYFWWGAYSIELLELRAGDVLHTALPLFHINALNTLSQALLIGATQMVEPRFSVSGYWEAMRASGATVTYLLGAMIPMLLSRPESPAEREHRVRVALGPGVPPALLESFRRRCGVELIDGYGSTETNFVIGSTVAERREGWMGLARDGISARVVDDADNELPRGTAGELVLRADDPFAFAAGYFGMAEKTVEAWRNLWFHTGDRVIQDDDGYFRFVDRLKEAIRRRGENISSFEVEQVLLSHPDVASAAAYPVGSELAEDEVMVAIVRREGSRLSAVELMDFCKPRLPYFALPRFVEFMADLPRTENGKIRKFLLRERGVGVQTWDRDAAGYRVR